MVERGACEPDIGVDVGLERLHELLVGKIGELVLAGLVCRVRDKDVELAQLPDGPDDQVAAEGRVGEIAG